MKRFERARARHVVLPVIVVVASLVMAAAAQARSRGRDEGITDDPSATTPGSERFRQVIAPRYGRVLRGVALAPDGERGRRR